MGAPIIKSSRIRTGGGLRRCFIAADLRHTFIVMVQAEAGLVGNRWRVPFKRLGSLFTMRSSSELIAKKKCSAFIQYPPILECLSDL